MAILQRSWGQVKPALGAQLDISHPINQGLVGWWIMNEGGGLTAYDLTQNRNHGTLTNGPTWADGKFGKALNFDGSNDRVDSGNVLNFTTESFSFGAWAKYPTQTLAANLYPGIVSKTQNDTGLGYGIFVSTSGDANDNKPYAGVSDGTNGPALYALAAKNDSLWHFFFAVADRAAQLLYFYVDGISQGSASISAVGSPTNTGTLSFGNRQSTAGFVSPFNGSIDNVRIYNRALSASETSRLYYEPFAGIITPRYWIGRRTGPIRFITGAHTVTPAVTHASSVVCTILATTAGNDLIVAVQSGDDPASPASVTSITATGATFIFQGAITNGNARAELWTAHNISSDITSVTINWGNATVGVVNISEYSGISSFGQVVTNSGSGANPTISLTTVDTNNFMVSSIGNESTAQSPFSTASSGNLREKDYALGDGVPDVAGCLIDNSSTTPASIACTLTYASLINWAAVAIELRSITVSIMRTIHNVRQIRASDSITRIN